MSSRRSPNRRPRSVSPTTSSYPSYDDSHSHHHGRRKHHHSHSTFSTDLLKTAISALGEAVVTGREDGHHHQHKHHYEDYDSRSIVAPRNKAADQVYDTLLQAAYTLGEVVGDLERKLGVNKDDEKDDEYGRPRRSRTERHGDRSGEDFGNYEDWDRIPNAAGYDSGYEYSYEGTGTAVPPSRGPRYYPEEYYSPGRPYPLRRASSNPEFEFEPPHDDDRRSARSSHRSKKDSKAHRNRSRSSSRSSTKSKSEKKKKKSKEEMILHNLPGLITRAAFILELIELNKKHKEKTGMAAKYAALLMALKLVKQLRREYRWMSERREGIKEAKGR